MRPEYFSGGLAVVRVTMATFHLNQYQQKGQLGKNDSCQLWEKKTPSGDPTDLIVLKEIRPPTALSNRQLKRLKSLQDDCLAHILAKVEAGKKQYLARKYLDGDNLLQWRLSFGSNGIPSAQLTQVCSQLLEAVLELHESSGLYHGNLKPENIILSRPGLAMLAASALHYTDKFSIQLTDPCWAQNPNEDHIKEKQADFYMAAWIIIDLHENSQRREVFALHRLVQLKKAPLWIHVARLSLEQSLRLKLLEALAHSDSLTIFEILQSLGMDGQYWEGQLRSGLDIASVTELICLTPERALRVLKFKERRHIRFELMPLMSILQESESKGSSRPSSAFKGWTMGSFGPSDSVPERLLPNEGSQPSGRIGVHEARCPPNSLLWSAHCGQSSPQASASQDSSLYLSPPPSYRAACPTVRDTPQSLTTLDQQHPYSGSSVEEDDDLYSVVKNIGLSVKFWVPVLKERLFVETPEAFAYVDPEELRVAIGPLCRRDWEMKALLNLLPRPSTGQDSQHSSRRINPEQERSPETAVDTECTRDGPDALKKKVPRELITVTESAPEDEAAQELGPDLTPLDQQHPYSGSSVEEDDDLYSVVKNVGLSAKFWVPVLKERLFVETPEAFTYVDPEELRVAIGALCRRDWEMKALLNLLPRPSTGQDSQHSSRRINPEQERSPETAVDTECTRDGPDALKKRVPRELITVTESAPEDEAAQEPGPDLTALRRDLLSQLGLMEFYPKKLTHYQILKWFGRELKGMKDIVPIFLNRLIAMDSKAREDTICDIYWKLKNKLPHVQPIHPLDIIVATYLCADDFLRILLSEKLFLCRHSIPYYLPEDQGGADTILHQPLHGLNFGAPLISTPSRIVAFMRLGNPQLSKSKLANDMCDCQAEIFPNHNLLSANVHSLISQGTVDIGWFLPPKNSQTDKTMAMLNLHGDAKHFQAQRDFLIGIATRCIVVVSASALTKKQVQGRILDILAEMKEAKSDGLMVIVSPDVDGSNVEGQQDLITRLNNTLGSEFTRKNVHIALAVTLFKPKQCMDFILEAATFQRLEAVTKNYLNKASLSTVALDEAEGICLDAQMAAAKAVKYIGENTKYCKEKHLPLHAGLWRDWARANKKLKRCGKDVEKKEADLEKLTKAQLAFRRKQKAKVESGISPLMQLFLDMLQEQDKAKVSHFLFWLKVKLDEISRHVLSKKHKEHDDVWNQLEEAKKNNDTAKTLDLQEKFQALDQDIASHSLGVEHIMREMAQIYESGLRNDLTQKLPELCADLLLEGHPLELMDGDASHVPEEWISSVLNVLARKLKGARVFILSVLGIQSSGKSTLLNAMFGLKFAVSAGRCTRGVYAQLVPAPEGGQRKYEYILVVDTEGLRAPELGNSKESFEHDHEIATFVMGLGDVTIINIKGENHAEMQDILQIVLHAYLRMIIAHGHKVEEQAYSVFVHQNVAAPEAKEKMLASQRALLNNLDKMTEAAASDLHSEGKYKMYNDLVIFDVKEHAKYFCDLFQGQPPMAPTSIGYAENVIDLKSLILDELAAQKTILTLEDTKAKLSQVWEGVLRESFIFSFKNAIEVRAYGSLEHILCELSYKLQNRAAETTMKYINLIEAQVGQLDIHYQRGIDAIKASLDVGCEEALQELNTFLNRNQDRNVMEQWLCRSKRRLTDIRDDLVKQKKRTLESSCEWRKSQLNMDQQVECYREELKSKSKALALRLKSQSEGNNKLSRSELKELFELIWLEVLDKMPAGESRRDILIEAKVIFQNANCRIPEEMLWHVWSTYETRESLSPEELLNMLFPWKDTGVVRRFYNWAARHLSPEEERAENLKALQTLVRNCQMAALQWDQSGPFDTGDLTEIQQLWNKCHQNLILKRNDEHMCMNILMANWTVLTWAVQKLETRQTEYLKKRDLRTCFHEQHHESMFRLFCTVYYQTEALGGVEAMTGELWNTWNKQTKRSLDQKLTAMLKTEEHLKTKHALQKSALKELLLTNCFQDFYLYLKDTGSALRKHIAAFVQKALFSRTLAESKFHTVSRELYEESVKHFRDCLLDTSNPEEDVQGWLRALSAKLNENGIHVPERVFDLELDASDCKELNVEFLRRNMDQMFMKLFNEEVEKLQSMESVPDEVLSQILDDIGHISIGCPKQCPFCKAVCDRSFKDHENDPSCLIHYPQGLGQYRYNKNEKLCTETCSYSIHIGLEFINNKTRWKPHPYSRYKELYPNWTIESDPTGKSSLLWQHVFAKYNKEFAQAYGAKEAKIPKKWHDIEVNSVLVSIDHELKEEEI